MESSAEPGMSLPKYCSMATTLEAPIWASTAPPWDLSFTCPFALRASWHKPFTRCSCYHPYLHIVDPAWQGPGWLGRVRDASDSWALARREPDGFYYWARIKAAPELERQGALLVEFDAPLVTGPKLPAQRQSVVLGEDVIHFSPFMEYSLQPGDKVLAPWEADRQRYGPATVLGLEAREPQRASKEEEIMVYFWNSKIAAVPLGGVRWVSSAVWKKAVERLHNPSIWEHPSPHLWATCCFPLGSVTGCVGYGLPLGTPFLCPPCHPNACCQLLCQGTLCCCPLAGPTWWPLSRTSGLTARGHPEMELKSTKQLLPLEGPKEEEVSVQAPVAVFPSSSPSEEEGLEKALETGFPQRQMVDSTVNTDPILTGKSLRRQGDLCQPQWRYWRRNRPELHSATSGTRYCNIQKEEMCKKRQRQAVVMGNTKELVLEATNTKPLQIPPEDAEHRKLGRYATACQREPKSS